MKQKISILVALVMLFNLSVGAFAQVLPNKNYFKQTAEYKNQGDKLLEEIEKTRQAQENVSRYGITYEDFKKEIIAYAQKNKINVKEADIQTSWQNYVKQISKYERDYLTLVQIFNKKTYLEVITDSDYFLAKSVEEISYDGKKYDRTSFLHAAVKNLATRHNTGYFDKDNQAKQMSEGQKIEAMSQIYEIVSREGFNPQDKELVYNFTYNIIANGKKYFDNDFFVKHNLIPAGLRSARNRQKNEQAKDARQLQASIVAQAMVLLPVLSNTSEKKAKSAKAIYEVASKIMRNNYGTIGIVSGSEALIALKTEDSLNKLYTLLSEDLYRGIGTEVALYVLDSFSIEEWAKRNASFANGIKNGLGQYHNAIARRFLYIDPKKNSADKIRIASAADESLESYYNIVYTDILEDIGKTLGSYSKDAKVSALINKLVSKYVKEVEALKVRQNNLAQTDKNGYQTTIASKADVSGKGRGQTAYERESNLHTSLIVGILATTKQKSENLTKAAKIIYNGYWWDLTEATQRDKNNIAAKYLGAQKKGYNAQKQKQFAMLTKAKNVGRFTDIFVQAAMLGKLVISIPNIVRAVNNFARRIVNGIKAQFKTQAAGLKPVAVEAAQARPAQVQGAPRPALEPAKVAEPAKVNPIRVKPLEMPKVAPKVVEPVKLPAVAEPLAPAAQVSKVAPEVAKTQIAAIAREVKYDILGKYYQRSVAMSVLPFGLEGISKRLGFLLTNRVYLNEQKLTMIRAIVDNVCVSIVPEVSSGIFSQRELRNLVLQKSLARIQESTEFTAQEKADLLRGKTINNEVSISAAKENGTIVFDEPDNLAYYQQIVDASLAQGQESKLATSFDDDTMLFEEPDNLAYYQQIADAGLAKNAKGAQAQGKNLNTHINEDSAIVFDEPKNLNDYIHRVNAKSTEITQVASKVKSDILKPYNQTPLMASFVNMFLPVNVFKEVGKRVNAFLTNRPYLSAAKQAQIRIFVDEAAAELSAEGIHTWDIEDAIKQRVFKKIKESPDFTAEEKKKLIPESKDTTPVEPEESNGNFTMTLHVGRVENVVSGPETINTVVNVVRDANHTSRIVSINTTGNFPPYVKAEVVASQKATKSYKKAQKAIRKGHIKDGLTYLSEAISYNESNPVYYYERAMLEWYNLGDKELAIEDIKNACKYNPNKAKYKEILERWTKEFQQEQKQIKINGRKAKLAKEQDAAKLAQEEADRKARNIQENEELRAAKIQEEAELKAQQEQAILQKDQEIYEKAKAKNKKIEKYQKIIDTKMQSGDYAGTISYYTKILKIEESGATYYKRAEAYLRTGQTALAKADYRKALELDPKNVLKDLRIFDDIKAELKIDRGQKYSHDAQFIMEMKDNLSAIDKLEMALRNEPGNVEYQALLEQAKQAATAEEYYARALENKKYGNTQKAYEDFEMAVSKAKDKTLKSQYAIEEARFLRYVKGKNRIIIRNADNIKGLSYYTSYNDAAMAKYNQAVEYAPTAKVKARYLTERAEFKRLIKDFDGAKADLEQAGLLSKSKRDSIAKQAANKVKGDILGKYEQNPLMMSAFPFGGKRLAAFLTNRPYLSEAKIAKVKAMAEQVSAEAQQALTEGKIADTDIEAVIKEKLFTKIQESSDFTAKEKEELCKTFMSKAELLYKKAFALKEEYKYEEALPLIEEAIKMCPNNATYHDLAFILNFRDNPQKALENITKAIELDKNNANYYMERAELEWYRLDNAKEAALKDVKTAADLNPKYQKSLKYFTEQYEAEVNDSDYMQSNKNESQRITKQEEDIAKTSASDNVQSNRRSSETITKHKKDITKTSDTDYIQSNRNESELKTNIANQQDKIAQAANEIETALLAKYEQNPQNPLMMCFFPFPLFPNFKKMERAFLLGLPYLSDKKIKVVKEIINNAAKEITDWGLYSSTGEFKRTMVLKVSADIKYSHKLTRRQKKALLEDLFMRYQINIQEEIEALTPSNLLPRSVVGDHFYRKIMYDNWAKTHPDELVNPHKSYRKETKKSGLHGIPQSHRLYIKNDLYIEL